MPILTNVVARYFSVPYQLSLVKNPRYVGELENTEGGPVEGEVSFTPNRITVSLPAASAEPVIINRSYDPAWRSKTGKVVNMDSRLGIIPNQAGPQTIVVSYRPKAFYVGLTISLLTLASIVIYLIFSRARRVK